MRFFNLYSNILITKGAIRILVSDLQRNISELMPYELSEVLELLKNHSIEDVYSQFDEDSQKIIDEYLDFLIEKEMGFITINNWDQNFLPLDYTYENYNIISDMYIEINSIAQLEKIKESIINLSIKHLVVYSQRNFLSDELISIDKSFDDTPVESIQFFLPFNKEVNEDFLCKLHKNTVRIYDIIFYDFADEEIELKDIYRFSVFFSKDNINILSCGKVDVKYFNTNMTKILEAINFNSCLYKKIGVDLEGNIKNCPAMEQCFGNIKTTTLEEAIKHRDFKKYWSFTKDKIEVCKDCEFRYVCTDCRAYTERTHIDENNIDVSKPLKCGYDPYTGEWQEWSKNPLKEKAIMHYGF